MATFRQVYTTIWEDEFMEDCNVSEKLFWLLLLTNPKTTQCGIFRFRIKEMVFYSGFNHDQCTLLTKRFIEQGKIAYNWNTSEMCILNWAKYNLKRGGKPVWDCIKKELEAVKDLSLISTLVSTFDDSVNQGVKAVFLSFLDDSWTIRGQEEEKEEEKEEEVGKSDDSPQPEPVELEIFPSPFHTLSEADLKRKIGPKHTSLLKEAFQDEDFLRGAISLLSDNRWMLYLDWLEYKKSIQNGYKSVNLGLAKVLRQFMDHSEAQMKAALDKALLGGHKGLYPDKKVVSINSKTNQNGPIDAVCSADTAERLANAFVAGGGTW